MNKKIIDLITHNQQASFTGELSFPKVVQNLIEGGIERYYVDLIALQSSYYTIDGSLYTVSLPHPERAKSGNKFSEKEVIDALQAIQQGISTYPEFLNQIIKAGIVSYTAFLLGKQIHYTGAKGDLYIQHFPQRPKN